MTREEIIRITERITSGLATEEELVRYNKVFNAFQPAEDVWDEETMGSQAEVVEQIHRGIAGRTKVVPLQRSNVVRWLVAASVAVLLVIGGMYLWNDGNRSNTGIVQKKEDIQPPNGNKAVLTLANGRQILLDNNNMNDTLSTQGDVTIVGRAGGEILYSGSDEQVSINSIAVPKGSNPVSLTLADGTSVWVDAGSSLKFPTAFPGKEREVTLSGQAYFEVNQAAGKPFFVYNTHDQTKVEVLGTSFNVKAFNTDAAVHVTLIDGAVNVRTPRSVKTLHPMEQAIATGAGEISINGSANMEQVLAWKAGMFVFDGNDVHTIMEELERFYNINIVYTDNNINERFVLRMPRNVPVSEVLDALSMTGLVQFKIEGRTIFVSN